MRLATGDRLGRYEIVAPLGAGGMGEVFRARDLELEREVAVKVLPGSVATDPARLERFRREARALAALSHPNLLDVYDVGSDDGVHFVVTELLEGDSLRARIPAGGLPWQKTAEIGAAVAEGLAAAHGRGIVHRDLKPENLFVTTDGRVKILDFGLARVDDPVAAEAETATLSPPVTAIGVVMGTPGYMAPEQVKGGVADQRSDIFALGCVLYEMLSGRRAFAGDSSMEIMAAILKEEPAQLSSVGAAVPVELERAVHRCLEKHPEARFQAAADLAFSLRTTATSNAVPRLAAPTPGTPPTPLRSRRRWTVAAAGVLVVAVAVVGWLGLAQRTRDDVQSPGVEIVPNRIAVMPFENRTGDPTLDALGAVVADRISQGLSSVQPPRAAGFETGAEIVPASTIQDIGAHGRAAPVEAVARATGARIVVTGSYVLDGDELQFDATISDAKSGEVVRVLEPVSAPRNGPGQAIATLRDRTFMTVTDHLSPLLGVFADRRYPDIEAYRLFLTAMQYGYLGRVEEGAALFPRIMQLDPDFNRARSFMLLSIGPDRAQVVRSMIDALMERSAELTENQLLLIEAKEAQLSHNRESAYRLWGTLADRAPDNFMIAWFAMAFANSTNRPGNAARRFEPYRSTDQPMDNPTGFGLLRQATTAYHLLGRFDDELEQASRWRELVPDSLEPVEVEARAFAALGRLQDLDRLVAETVTAHRDAGSRGGFLLRVAEYLDARGYEERALELAERAADWWGDQELAGVEGAGCTVCRAAALIQAGRPAEARPLLDEAVAENPGNHENQLHRARCAALLGDRATAESIVADMGTWDDETAYNITYYRARIEALLGDRDDAIHLLQQALAQGLPFTTVLMYANDLRALRGTPEFEEILRPKG